MQYNADCCYRASMVETPQCASHNERDAMNIFEVDESSGLPVWVQLRNRFVYLISTGHYQPGDQLPSVRRLAAETSINYNTVSKVYVNLEHDGYVISVRGKGVYVRDVGKEKRDDTARVADAIIEDSIKRCLSMGMSIDEVQHHMVALTQTIKEESQSLASEKRDIYERKNGKNPAGQAQTRTDD
jgi:GntR family transcriptional regulator